MYYSITRCPIAINPPNHIIIMQLCSPHHFSQDTCIGAERIVCRGGLRLRTVSILTEIALPCNIITESFPTSRPDRTRDPTAAPLFFFSFFFQKKKKHHISSIIDRFCYNMSFSNIWPTLFPKLIEAGYPVLSTSSSRLGATAY